MSSAGGEALDDDDALTRLLETHCECQVCCEVMYEPATLGCGHSFCRECCVRALRHSRKCPSCRSLVTGGSAPAVSQTLRAVVRALAPAAYASRAAAHNSAGGRKKDPRGGEEEEEAGAPRQVGLFVLDALLPRQSMAIHVFEPRYRALVRAALRGDGTFVVVGCGEEDPPHRHRMVAPWGGGGDEGGPPRLASAATEVRIVDAKELADGRFVITVFGECRVRLLREWIGDEGYPVGSVEPMRDADLLVGGGAGNDSTAATAEFAALAAAVTERLDLWLRRVRGGRWERLAGQLDMVLRHLGDRPSPGDDPEAFGLWVAALINPVPGLDVAPEIRLAALEHECSFARLRALDAALRASLDFIDPENNRGYDTLAISAFSRFLAAVTGLAARALAALFSPFQIQEPLPLGGIGQ